MRAIAVDDEIYMLETLQEAVAASSDVAQVEAFSSCSAALAYAAQMLVGTGTMLLRSGMHPGALKDGVCSPGGSTIQGVRTLEEAGFRGAVMDAVIAAFEKNKELGK